MIFWVMGRVCLTCAIRSRPARFAPSTFVGMIFFFSSRRRHTRFDCDWSSDVCSSDLVRQLGLVNTRLALVLSYTTFCLPFCLWLLRAFFAGVPLELEEAAMVDGANRARAAWYVTLPLALPGLIAAGIFTFILAWNDFLFALLLIPSEELQTPPVRVNQLFNARM